MSAFLSQLRLDWTVAWRGKFVHVTVGMALFFGLLLRFAIPADLGTEQASEYVHDATGLFPLDGEVPAERQAASMEQLRTLTAEDGEAAGVAFTGSVADPAITFVLQGRESSDLQGLAAAAAKAAWIERGVPTTTGHTVATIGVQAPPPPLNQSMLPLLYGLDTVMLGFLFAGVMVLQEKTHGTVRFYRVSPGGTARYVASKVLVLTVVALTGGAAATAIVMPAGLLEPRLILLLALATATLTLLGLGLAVFFDNLSQFFYPMAGVGLLLSLPMVRYGLPSAGMAWTWWIPTDPVMFAGRELLLPAGRGDLIGSSLLYLAAVLVVASIGATLLIHRRLMKEAL